MTAREALQAIYDERGMLTPALVVDEARKSSHPLHSHFEWDNSVAAEAWRREQARDLIQSVRVVYRKADRRHGERSVRAYHSVPTENGRAYLASDDIVDDPLLRQIVLRDMEREWKTLKQRYAHFAEFMEMVLRDVEAA